MLTSGGFDPLHVGHLEYLERASQYGEVVVALNSDAWLRRKKGYVFHTFSDRWRILSSLKTVSRCYRVDDSDETVCEAIKTLRPDIFAKGGDRTLSNTPEVTLCRELGIQLLFGLGDKIRASSDLVNRSWGNYEVLCDRPGYKVKILTLLPGKSTSLQRHFKRNEHWINPQIDSYQFIRKKEFHQLRNPTNSVMEIVEVQTGVCEEEDIERA